MVKIKGHAKARHVASGQVLAIDKWGSDSVDALALKGGACHAAPAHFIAVFERRRVRSRATHRMMLCIMKARQRAENCLGFSTPDNHEDEAEDPWSLNEHMFVPHPRSGEG